MKILLVCSLLLLGACEQSFGPRPVHRQAVNPDTTASDTTATAVCVRWGWGQINTAVGPLNYLLCLQWS